MQGVVGTVQEENSIAARPWRMLFAELCETGGTSWGVYQAREDNLAILSDLRSVKCPRFFPGISRMYCEGGLTSHEVLVALKTWKHSFAEERVGLLLNRMTENSDLQKEESRARYSAFFRVSSYS